MRHALGGGMDHRFALSFFLRNHASWHDLYVMTPVFDLNAG